MPLYQSAELTLCDKRGSEFSLYLNLGNICTTPVWSFHKGVTGDLSLNETDDEEELTVRDPAQIVKQYNPGKTDIEISGQQTVDQLYEGNAFVNSARSGGSPIDVACLSGYIGEEGSAGWRGSFFNFDRSQSGPESGAATQNFRLKPAACQLTSCKVRPVKVATANAVADYDPSIYTPTA